MNLNLVAAEKDCFVELNIVAIGGGGVGRDSNGRGRGSGYVEASSVRINSSSPEAEILVGQVGESSKLEIAGELVFEALPGQYPGSDGYSGGGGSSHSRQGGGMGGSGGSDGGNGTNYPGGKGSGFDLSLVHLKNFILTPGAGGQSRERHNVGGGGGVTVNGKMPDVTSEYAGAGFGGGSAGSYPDFVGYQGCVMVEI